MNWVIFRLSMRWSVGGRFWLLLDGADNQANDAVVVSMEDSLLFVGSSGVDAVER